MTTRVVILAPAPLLRAGLETLLAGAGDVVIVPLPPIGAGDEADAAGDAALLERAVAVGADVVVWAPVVPSEVPATLGAVVADPGGTWGDAARATLPALVIVADVAPRDAAAAVRAGARAVLPNGVQGATLGAAVAAANLGLVVLPAADATAVLPAIGDEARMQDGSRPTAAGVGPGGGVAPNLPPLSARERDVLGLMAEGLANKQIAYRLGISEHTVKTHVAAVFGKLHAGTRAEAVVTAARAGLLLL